MPITNIKYQNEIKSSTSEPFPVSIMYDGEEVATATYNQSKILKVGNKLVGKDIYVGSKIIRIAGKRALDDIIVEVQDLVSLTIPTIGAYTYTGSVITPTINNYDSSLMAITGDESGKIVGSYSVVFSLEDKQSYRWSDGTQTDKTVNWSIGQATLATPSQNGSLTYNGSSQSPSWNNYDSSKMSISTVTPQTNAGSFPVTFTITDSNYKFSSGSTATVNWVINKATLQVLVNNATSISNTWDSASDATFTITNPSGGALSATATSGGSYFTPSLSGDTLTITAKSQSSTSNRTGTITITSAETTNYAQTTCTVNCTLNKSCFTGDTLVTLADYSVKRIDELTMNDDVLIYDFFKGEYSSAKPMLIFHHNDVEEYCRLTFSDGTIVKMVDGHKFFDMDKEEWVMILNETCQNFIGCHFAKVEKEGIISVELVDATIIKEVVTSYSAETLFHINMVFGGMLTFTPQKHEGIYEYFTIKNMKYDEELMNADIEKYGLYTADVFEPYGLSEEMFEAVGGPYFKIFVGKELLTFENVITLINEFIIPESQIKIIKK